MLAVYVMAFLTAFAATRWLFPAEAGDAMVMRRVSEVFSRSARGKAAKPEAVVDEEMELPFVRRVLVPLAGSVVQGLSRLAPGGMKSRLAGRLQEAGLPRDPVHFLGAKAALAGLLFLTLTSMAAAGETSLMSMAMPAVGLLLGWRLPDFWLSRRIQERRKAMERLLPDALDMLSVSVEAGLGFDGAIQKVAEKFPEPMSTELSQYLKEVRLGRSRAEALRALADRSALADMRSFVAAVIQADQLGVNIARVLKGQSEALRVRRRQRAQEKAMQIPLKLLLPLIVFIFPTIFIVILGPVGISLTRFFGGMQ